MTTKEQEEALEREEAERLGISVEELRARFWRLLGDNDDLETAPVEMVLQIRAAEGAKLEAMCLVVEALEASRWFRVEKLDDNDDERIGIAVILLDDDELEQGEGRAARTPTR
jgi:hypothetical protein